MHHQNANILEEVKLNYYYQLYKDLPEITIGNKIRKLRMINNISQSQLATKVKNSRGTIDTFENDAACPSPKAILRISNALKIPVEYFYDDYYKFVFSNFSEILKRWRAENHLSQRQAGKLLNVDAKTLFTWENGNHMDRISFEKIRKIVNP